MSRLQYPWPETPQPGTTLEVAPGYTSEAVLSVFDRNGLDPERSRAMAAMRGNHRYAELVPGFAHAYRRIIEGDRLRIGGRDWQAIIGHGHARSTGLFSRRN